MEIDVQLVTAFGLILTIAVVVLSGVGALACLVKIKYEHFWTIYKRAWLIGPVLWMIAFLLCLGMWGWRTDNTPTTVPSLEPVPTPYNGSYNSTEKRHIDVREKGKDLQREGQDNLDDFRKNRGFK